MSFDPLPIGYRLSSGATIGGRIGVNTYAIIQPRVSIPSAGAFPKAAPAANGGNGGGVVVVQAGGCSGNGGTISPYSAQAQARGASKRPDFGPVVAFTSQTMPKGFAVGARAFGIVIPEGR
jgi:hypothetical protein